MTNPAPAPAKSSFPSFVAGLVVGLLVGMFGTAVLLPAVEPYLRGSDSASPPAGAKSRKPTKAQMEEREESLAPGAEAKPAEMPADKPADQPAEPAPK